MFRYRYHVLAADNGPFGLMRVRKGEPAATGTEHYTPGTGWERRQSPINVTGPGSTARPIPVWQVRRYRRRMDRRAAKNLVCRYYVVVTDYRPKDSPYALVREWVPETGPSRDEYFSPQLTWERTMILDDLSRDRLNGTAEPIAKAELKRYVALFTRRYQDNRSCDGRAYSYYVIVSDIQPKWDPYALVRVRGPMSAFPDEEFFSPRLKWERTRILCRIEHCSMDREPERIDEWEVERYVDLLTRRFKRQQEG